MTIGAALLELDLDLTAVAAGLARRPVAAPAVRGCFTGGKGGFTEPLEVVIVLPEGSEEFTDWPGENPVCFSILSLLRARTAYKKRYG